MTKFIHQGYWTIRRKKNNLSTTDSPTGTQFVADEPHRWHSARRHYATSYGLKRSPVISATSRLGDSQVGDKPTRRQPTRRHESVNSATIYFVWVFVVLIEQNRLNMKAVLSQGNHAMLLLISNTGYGVCMASHLKQVAGHANVLTEPVKMTARSMTEGLLHNSLQLLLLLRLQQVPTVGVFLFLIHRLEPGMQRR